MRSFTSETSPSRMRDEHRRPRPRRGRGSRCGWSSVSLMEGGLSPEGGRVRGDAAEGAQQLRVVGADLPPVGREGFGVGLLLRAEAAEAAARVRAGRARRSRRASRARGTAMPFDTMTQGDARALALDADAVRRHVRAPPGEERADDLEQLLLVDRAALQLEVDVDVVGDRRSTSAASRCSRDSRRRPRRSRRRWRSCAAPGSRPPSRRRRCVTRTFELRRISWIRSASCGVVIEPSTSERSYGPFGRRARRLEEVRDLDRAGDRQQLVLAVEQRQLAAVARRELPDGETWLGHSSRTSRSGASSSQR